VCFNLPFNSACEGARRSAGGGRVVGLSNGEANGEADDCECEARRLGSEAEYVGMWERDSEAGDAVREGARNWGPLLEACEGEWNCEGALEGMV
jgi:hypothetical protein